MYVLKLEKGDWIYHIKKLLLAVNKLKLSVINCYSEIYFFGKTKTEYLGVHVRHNGIKNHNKQINSINIMTSQNSQKEVHSFIFVLK